MKVYPMLLMVSAKNKRAQSLLDTLKSKGPLRGYTEVVGSPEGFRIWLNARSNDEKFVESFFHEAARVLFRIRKKRLKREDELCHLLAQAAARAVVAWPHQKPSRPGNLK